MKEYFSYENYGTNTYLKFTFPKDLEIDEFTLGMITNNNMDGFLQSIYGSMDDTKYIKYNVSSKITIKQFFSGTVNKRRLINVFHGILSAYITAEDYMIETKNIMLDLDYIFVNVSTCKVEVLCLPCEVSSESANDMMLFFKNLIFTLKFDQSENCDYIARLINYLNSAGSFSYVEFKNVVDSIYETLSCTKETSMGNTPYNIQYTQVASKSKEPVNTQKSTDFSQNIPKQPQVQKNFQLNSTPVTERASNSSSSVSAVMERPPQASALQGSQVNIPPSPMNQRPQAGVVVSSTKIPQTQQRNAHVVQGTEEKHITLMYLLQHYNKENAEMYKAQKQAKKNNDNVPSVPQSNSAPITRPSSVPQPSVNAVSSAPIIETVPSATVNQQNSGFQPTPVIRNEYSPTNQIEPSFGATTVLNAEPRAGETTVLGMGNPNASQHLRMAYLIRRKNSEKIPIDKNDFYIGKEKSFVDYFISDNPAISRSHANITIKNGEFYIVDTNSTNHTFIDGKMIPSGVEVKLESGSELTLANEKFDFQII